MRLRSVGIDEWLMRRREDRRRKIENVGRMEGAEESIRLRASFCRIQHNIMNVSISTSR